MSNRGYGCDDEGEDWIKLDDKTFSTADCELLCLKEPSGDGCCLLDLLLGCYWKRGSYVKAISDDSRTLAVNCSIDVSSKCSIIFIHSMENIKGFEILINNR